MGWGEMGWDRMGQERTGKEGMAAVCLLLSLP